MATQAEVGQFETLASGIYLEGLAVDYDRGAVWFSDVIGGGIHGIARDGRTWTLNPERMWTGGIFMNADGKVLSSGQGGIMWNDPETGASGWVIQEIDGKPINGINEMCPDGHGGLYCGTVDLEMIEQGKPARPATIYRIKSDGTVSVAADNLGFANALMLSSDACQLFYNDTFDSTYAFDVGADGTLGERKKLLEKYDCDGMALDAEGNLLLTGFRSSHLERIRPDGTVLPQIDTPAYAITQVRFGGADMRDYYITSVSAEGGDSLKEGKPLTEKNSFLIRGRAEVPGMKISPARFTLT